MLKELEIWIKIQSMPLFLDIAKLADFRWKNADVNKTQGVSHIIYIFVGSSLSKV